MLLRLSMRLLELLALSAAMFLLPFAIHSTVQCFDHLHEFMSRRAQSPYASVSWGSIGFALLVLVGWHVALGRVGYWVVPDATGGKGTGTGGVTWGRVLGRIVIPLGLGVLGVQFLVQVWGRRESPMPFVRVEGVR